MANTIASPYASALGAQKQQLEGFVNDRAKAITLPAAKIDARDKLLNASGWVMAILGVISFIAGFIVSNDGLIWAGVIAIMSGIYCYYKALQIGRQRAYAASAQNILTDLGKLNDDVAGKWNDFMKTQNESLARDIIGSAAANDAKTAMVESMGIAPVNIDTTAVAAAMNKAAADESAADFSKGIADYVATASGAIDKTIAAQQAIYSSIDKI